MTPPLPRALLLEAYRRLRLSADAAVTPIVSAIRDEMFAEQLAVIDDPSREKAECCTRRAGKNGTEERYGPIEALRHPGSLIRYWAITRQRCKELYWLPLKQVLERHRVAVKANDSELRIFFPNHSEIRLVGADKDKEVQKKRGDKTRLEIVGEAQAFGSFLKSLVEDVVEPCLTDLRGTMLAGGTPGALCAGYWYSMSGSKEHERAKRWTSPGRLVGGVREGQGWSCHRWSVLDNPHMKHMLVDLPKLKAKRGWSDEHPTWRREWLAQWVNDEGALFYKFNPSLNLHNRDESELRGPGWLHVLGWDLGHNDDMAKVVWAFNPKEPCLYEAFSWSKPGALLDECAGVDAALGERFDIVGRVADTGGGGKLFVAEYARRYPHMPAYEAAEKTKKYEHVRLFNDDLMAARLKLRDGSPLHLQLSTLPKDPDWPDEKVPREDPRFPNHCPDAGLYAYRRAFHYLHAPEETAPPVGSTAAAEAVEKEIERQQVEWGQQQEERPWWEQ